MPAIENVTRRGAVYWWRRRMRFVAGIDGPITITVTASLQKKIRRPRDNVRLL